jgi:predicted AAA+ superfamily ATPase
LRERHAERENPKDSHVYSTIRHDRRSTPSESHLFGHGGCYKHATRRVGEDERAAFTIYILTPNRYASLGVIHIKTSGLFPTHQHSLTGLPVTARYEAVANTQNLSVVWAIAGQARNDEVARRDEVRRLRRTGSSRSFVGKTKHTDKSQKKSVLLSLKQFMMKRVYRKQYMETLRALRDKDVIKMMTGVRRSGKSTIMQMFRDELIKDGVPERQIYFANFEDIDNAKWLNDYIGFYAYLKTQLDFTKSCYVFLDEVQLVKDFERLVDGLYVKPNVDVYVTGSNGYLLSSEMGTLLTGRYISIHVLPFSFKEYFEASDHDREDIVFMKYLQNGGMPGVLGMNNEQMRIYSNDILQNILQKDILVRNRWRKTENFDNVIHFLMDSIGSPVSSAKIANVLKSQGIDISHKTVAEYIQAAVDSYLFYKVQRMDLKGKGILKTQEKYYLSDLSFKQARLGKTAEENIGHHLENIVFLELLRRNNMIHIGKVHDKEIDFVARNLVSGWTEYYQVSYSVRDKTTFEREIASLSSIRDYNHRTLLTMDIEPESDNHGIRRINIMDWLLDK